MSHCCDKNPLQRSGTNQPQRFLAGLRPGYISVDERDYADWIFFAEEFSRFLNYYDTNDAKSGDWQAFFSTDISAVLGSIAIQDTDAHRRSIKERFDFIKDDKNAGSLLAIKQKLNELFSSLLTLSEALDMYLQKLPDKNIDGENDFVFKTSLLNSIKTKLAPALRRLLSYYFAVDGVDANNAADGSEDYLENSTMNGWKILNRQVESAEVLIWNRGLSKNWWDSGEADWKTFVKNVALSPDISVFGLASWLPDVYRRINHAASHNLFSSIFDQYLQSYTKIVQDAEKELLTTLSNWNVHPPHYALFLSFLRLFRFSQFHINTITKRHLDFYYREILHLQPKDAEPNHAHILTELAKPVNGYALHAATGFKAGKDSEGKEVIYTLDKETTFNKAKVVFLKSVYKGNTAGKDDHHKTDNPASIIINNKGRLFASPVANSNDGLGAKLKSAHNEWHPYANKKFTDGQLTDVVMPDAQIGFAVASHYLYLMEGERQVYLRFVLNNNTLLTNSVIEGYLTTEKGWYKVSSASITAGFSAMTDTSPCTEISFLIPGDAPAITNYNAAVHGGTYNVSVPVLKIYLINEDGITPYPYDTLKGLTVSKTEIKVEVGNQSAYSQTGLKQLMLSNDFGPVDASKPFMPFGPIPKKDATFVIGNKEIFCKKNSAIKLNIEWAGLPSSQADIDYGGSDPDYYPKTKVNFLSGGIWKGNSDDASISGDVNVFNNINVKVPVFTSQQVPALSTVGFNDDYSIFNSKSNSGFLRLILNADFGHKAFLTAQAIYLINKSKNPEPAGNTPPTEPYTPTIQSLYLTYSAYTSHNLSENDKTKFEQREIRFFHICPFGEAEQHAYLSGNAVSSFLFPQFSHDGDAGTVYHSGEFYIGIEKLSAEQSVNILFQLMEGSSDPLVAKPEKHIHWSYLGNNIWLPFDEQQISDSTLQLVQSGIISFIIPEDATTANTLLPSGYLWLRGSVASAPEAVCKLITVDAQATVVTFAPHDNAADFLDTALAAEKISKLKQPDSSVKKITQPYSSFGGRAREGYENYYVRVSERLRHKARAITIWDYEHLVLEAFPSIHKVKCLNHTKFDTDPVTGITGYNEVSPGYVTIITIPDLKNRNDANPLRPYTNQDVLTKIEDYLREKTSCHVKLKAKHPRFEEVSVSLKLKLMKGYDDFTFYSNKLKDEITQFLTPWAYNTNVDVQFGGKIEKSVIINFIEERSYVDFITDVYLYHNPNPDNEDTGGCDEDVTEEMSGLLEEVQASTARSILVSVPAKKHDIGPVPDPLPATEADCPGIIKQAPIFL